MVERRRSERAKSLLKAKIVFNNRMTSHDCVIKNISTHGARLAVSQSSTVPSEFDLVIPIKGKTYRAKMRWRDAEGMGVEFMEEAEARETIGGASTRHERLMAENARLKSAIQTLAKKLEDLGQDVPKYF